MESMDVLTEKVIGAAIEVHTRLGPGYLESVYEEALCYELELREILFERQKVLAVKYKGRIVGDGRLDLLIDNRLIVELKSTEALLPIHVAQVLSYLKMNRLELALLINFNVIRLTQGIKRIINNK